MGACGSKQLKPQAGAQRGSHNSLRKEETAPEAAPAKPQRQPSRNSGNTDSYIGSRTAPRIPNAPPSAAAGHAAQANAGASEAGSYYSNGTGVSNKQRHARRHASYAQAIASANADLKDAAAADPDVLKHYSSTIVIIAHNGVPAHRASLITDILPLLTSSFNKLPTLQAREWVIRGIAQLVRCARGEPAALSAFRDPAVLDVAIACITDAQGRDHAPVAMHACDLIRYLVIEDADRSVVVAKGVPALLGAIITYSTTLDTDNELVKSAFQAVLAIGPTGQNGVVPVIAGALSQHMFQRSVVGPALASVMSITADSTGAGAAAVLEVHTAAHGSNQTFVPLGLGVGGCSAIPDADTAVIDAAIRREFANNDNPDPDDPQQPAPMGIPVSYVDKLPPDVVAAAAAADAAEAAAEVAAEAAAAATPPSAKPLLCGSVLALVRAAVEIHKDHNGLRAYARRILSNVAVAVATAGVEPPRWYLSGPGTDHAIVAALDKRKLLETDDRSSTGGRSRTGLTSPAGNNRNTASTNKKDSRQNRQSNRRDARPTPGAVPNASPGANRRQVGAFVIAETVEPEVVKINDKRTRRMGGNAGASEWAVTPATGLEAPDTQMMGVDAEEGNMMLGVSVLRGAPGSENGGESMAVGGAGPRSVIGGASVVGNGRDGYTNDGHRGGESGRSSRRPPNDRHYHHEGSVTRGEERRHGSGSRSRRQSRVEASDAYYGAAAAANESFTTTLIANRAGSIAGGAAPEPVVTTSARGARHGGASAGAAPAPVVMGVGMSPRGGGASPRVGLSPRGGGRAGERKPSNPSITHVVDDDGNSVDSSEGGAAARSVVLGGGVNDAGTDAGGPTSGGAAFLVRARLGGGTIAGDDGATETGTLVGGAPPTVAASNAHDGIAYGDEVASMMERAQASTRVGAAQ